MHKISVIIPTLNEEYFIGNLLTDLKKQSYKVNEIIIVDGKSNDNTVQIAKSFHKVRIFSSVRNPGIQRNLGGKKASGDILIFLDADVRLHDDFIKQVYYIFTNNFIDIACTKYIPYPGSLSISFIYKLFNFLFFLSQKILPSGAGSCIIIRNTIFKKEHGFNTVYTYDDLEFIRRLGGKYRYRMLPVTVLVSDRRFRKYGIIRTSCLYVLLSFFFLLNRFDWANKIPYTFGIYNNEN